MFDHITGHQQAIKQLIAALKSRTLPRALLISGPPACGKFTIAIEIARLLNCIADGAADCDCANCAATARLSHPGIAIAGNRYAMAELGRVFEVARAHVDERSIRLLIFSVRKIINRLDARFFTHPNSQHQRKLTAAAATTEQHIQSIEALTAAQRSELLEHYTKIEKQIADIVPLFPPHIAVNTMRAIRHWIYEPPDSALHISYKVAIIEQAEELSQSSANTMLKVVEEPPQRGVIIFLATHSAAILPTLRSRVREFALYQRAMSQEHEIILDIFRHDSERRLSLFEFINSYSAFHRSIYELSTQFVEAIEHHSTLYTLTRTLTTVTADKRFGRQEVGILLHAIRKNLIDSWQERQYDRQYTQFVHQAFAILRAVQYDVTTLNFNIRDMALSMLIHIKKSYAALH